MFSDPLNASICQYLRLNFLVDNVQKYLNWRLNSAVVLQLNVGFN